MTDTARVPRDREDRPPGTAPVVDQQLADQLISRVTDGVLEELQEWQSQPLDSVCPVIFIDALMVKIRDGVVSNRPVCLAIGIDCDGARQVLGLWVGPATGESARFWLTVLSELKARGVADARIVCCDGLTGLPGAIGVVWPPAVVQLSSLRTSWWRDGPAGHRAVRGGPVQTFAFEARMQTCPSGRRRAA